MTSPEYKFGADDLASKLFSARRAMADAEDEIEDALVKAGILPSLTDGWEDWGHDYYDTSIEIKYAGPNVILTAKHLVALHEMGFSRIWTYGSDGERYYSTNPRTPDASMTISNESGSDGVSLKSDTSLRPQSMGGGIAER
jgi:hypothetical protein